MSYRAFRQMCAFSAICRALGLSLAATKLLQRVQYDAIRGLMPLTGRRSNRGWGDFDIDWWKCEGDCTTRGEIPEINLLKRKDCGNHQGRVAEIIP